MNIICKIYEIHAIYKHALFFIFIPYCFHTLGPGARPGAQNGSGPGLAGPGPGLGRPMPPLRALSLGPGPKSMKTNMKYI